MKPEPARLALDTYPFVTQIEPRFGDMDVQGHLNNVALARLYEEGRVRFTATFGGVLTRDHSGRPMLAEVRIRYLAEGRYPGTLTAAAGVQKVGRSSYVFAQALFQNDRCIGIAETVVVWTVDARPAPIPDNLRTALDAALIEQSALADA